jgi:hypothetical protein
MRWGGFRLYREVICSDHQSRITITQFESRRRLRTADPTAQAEHHPLGDRGNAVANNTADVSLIGQISNRSSDRL